MGSNYPRGKKVPVADRTVVVTSGVLRAKNPGTSSASIHRMARSVFVEEAAQLLGVCRRTVYYRIREGRLRTVRTPGGSQRVLVESIEALLRDEVGGVRVPGADVSGTDLSGKSPGT